MKLSKTLLLSFIGSLFISQPAISQEISVPKSLRTMSNTKCYWSYSVERKSTTHDSIHKYVIRVQLIEKDSIGNYNWTLQVKHGLIFCSYNEKNNFKKIYFKKVGRQWIADFKIFTNQPLPLKIVANYNHQETIMPLTLNEGTYPGEPDS
jgi:hypothetical protein